jgi:hypothetical protein
MKDASVFISFACESLWAPLMSDVSLIALCAGISIYTALAIYRQHSTEPVIISGTLVYGLVRIDFSLSC